MVDVGFESGLWPSSVHAVWRPLWWPKGEHNTSSHRGSHRDYSLLAICWPHPTVISLLGHSCSFPLIWEPTNPSGASVILSSYLTLEWVVEKERGQPLFRGYISTCSDFLLACLLPPHLGNLCVILGGNSFSKLPSKRLHLTYSLHTSHSPWGLNFEDLKVKRNSFFLCFLLTSSAQEIIIRIIYLLFERR